ncbi:MAG: peptide-methionine (S)-S-oxide reductase MsrA [Acidimicrobiia bacterium]|nr:MAG: peptide-methionine (S)-S-oxide reductase MsrA [Acidimicrobiia bacterium]
MSALRCFRMFRRKPHSVPDALDALPGRPAGPDLSGIHFLNGKPIIPPFPDGIAVVYVGMGCFWGAESIFWKLPGVYTTAVGYMGGFTENPTYEDVCTGRTGHAEVALVAYDPEVVTFDRILKSFWEEHDPTQKDRQGNDVGSQYRSVIYWTTEDQRTAALEAMKVYGVALRDAGYEAIATEIAEAGAFYYAEEYHQQYLAKNPGGYCNHGFCQIEFTSPVSLGE